MLRASYQLLKTFIANAFILSITHLRARYLHQLGDTKYIDVHKDDPAHSRNPADYDVLITDIDEDVLRTKVSKKFGIPYLSTPEASDLKPVREASGYVHEIHRRMMIPFVVGYKKRFCWGFFVYDTGCPSTYLSTQVFQTLGITEPPLGFETAVTIGGHQHLIYQSPSGSHFQHVNLMGNDFTYIHEVFSQVNNRQGRFKLLFNQTGHPWPEPKL